MTQTTRTILSDYQIRKTKKQKEAFRDYVQSIATEEGYSYHTEKGIFGAVNVVVGEPSSAKVIYTAHYDTCAVLPVPNFITPKNIGWYLLYQVFISVILILLPAALLGICMGGFCQWLGWGEFVGLILTEAVFLFVIFGIMALIIFGPANKHTVNDNTSGVTVLMDLMCEMPQELRHEVAFIFFDLEEAGLFGSAGYAKAHKKAMAHKLLLNFDCVSDGEHMIFVLGRGAIPYAQQLVTAFPTTEEVTSEVISKGAFYPSDQMNFPCGVGVAALKTMGKGKLLYMDKIHTSKDLIYREANIKYLVSGCILLTRRLGEI